MISKFLYNLTARLRCKLIKLDGEPYLERYYLGEIFGVTFYLHRFVSSDCERHLHNHPWRWSRSIVLTGSYVEERAFDLCPHAGPSGCITDSTLVRWYNVIHGSTFHQIRDATPNTWTLFFHSEKVMVATKIGGFTTDEPKGWGFLKAVYLYGTTVASATTFTPYPSSGGDWWDVSQMGQFSGRERHDYFK